MPYFDVIFKSPSGSIGTHYAVIADSEEEAAKISPQLVVSGSSVSADAYEIISVKPTPEENQPK